jgi:uncharacterized protein
VKPIPMKTILMLICLFLSHAVFATPVSDDVTVEKAMQRLYAANNLTESQSAMAEIIKLVDNGNAEAAFRLGRYYHLEAYQLDYKRAFSLYTLAMRKGHAWATNNIGLMYEEGRGIPSDINLAIDYYLQAADKGNSYGYSNLGKLFVQGNHLPHDPADAARWYQELGYQYRCGCYVKPNDAKSLYYNRKAAEMGSADALNLLGAVYADGDGVAINKKIAVQYWTQAAEKGVCRSLAHLGDSYDNGWGVALDRVKATQYYQKAVQCAQTDPWDFWKLGTRYRDAIGVEQDCEKAESLFQEAAKRGMSSVYADIGYMYQNGCGTIKPDPKKGFNLYLIGAKARDPQSQNNVGAMLKHGFESTAADRVRAYAWLSLAKENGNEMAATNLNDFATMFSDADRAAGQAHLLKIKQMLSHLTPQQFTDATLY